MEERVKQPEGRRALIEKIRCFVLDMDGTIYLGGELFPFTKRFLEAVGKSGRDFFFFTNNSSKNAGRYVEKLAGMGIDIPPERMLISNAVLIEYLLAKQRGKSCYVVGTPDLVADFERAGIPLNDTQPDIVVLGFDTTLTYEKLRRACHFVRNGCLYYGVNPDFNCPMEGGTFIPDCGSIARLIEASTGRLPEFFGKPSRRTLDFIVRRTGFPADRIAVIGDRMYTDIAVTQDSDASSILVLTGESSLEDALASPIQPDLIVPSLESLIPML